MARQNMVIVQWVPAHRSVAGNEATDDLAKRAAVGPSRDFSESQTRSGGRSASPTSTEEPPTVGPERRLSGLPPMCVRSEGTALQAVQDYAVRLCESSGSPWLDVTTSCFQATPRSGPPYTREWLSPSAGVGRVPMVRQRQEGVAPPSLY